MVLILEVGVTTTPPEGDNPLYLVGKQYMSVHRLRCHPTCVAKSTRLELM